MRSSARWAKRPARERALALFAADGVVPLYEAFYERVLSQEQAPER